MAFEQIRAKDIEKYFGKADVLIVDVREPHEYKSGHIPNAVNIPFRDFEEDINQLPLNREYILYCDRGNLSLFLARNLYSNGYDVKNIYGGINAYRGKLEL